MEIKLKPHTGNKYPLTGVLIRSTSIEVWVKEIQQMGLELSGITVYPIPGTTANSIWGCLVLFDHSTSIDYKGKNTFCQNIQNKIYIPEQSLLFPKISEEEVNKLFKDGIYVMHPDFGLVQLEEQVNWEELLEVPSESSSEVKAPAKTIFIPETIRSFQIKEAPPENILEELEHTIFPKKEKFKDKPLSVFEKIKLAGLKQLFRKKPLSTGESKETSTENKNWFQKLGNLLSLNKQPKWMDKLQLDYEELERRNQKELDKLLDLFKSNPEEALKYAIPLDESGTTRGGDKALFKLSRSWTDFSIFSSNPGRTSGGVAILPDNGYYKLQQQYNQAAQEFVQNKEYQKAAFVYMKLLKNNAKAAQTLEEGHLYPEAASVYLKHCNHKTKAAECYEKGKMYTSAIDLYLEMSDNEKAGDLYVTINKRKEAYEQYEVVIDRYKTTYQFVKASLIAKNKIGNPGQTQSLLLEGWRTDRDAINCLNNYFNNIEDPKELQEEIDRVYKQELQYSNEDKFLQVIKHEYGKDEKTSEQVKEIAYEIVARNLSKDPYFINELKAFNKKDKNLIKDIMKYTHSRRRKI